MSIGKRLKQLREYLGLSQEEFAQKIFRVKSTISQLENDKTPLTPSLSKAICVTFNVSEEWLIHGSGEMIDDCELTSRPKAKQIFDHLEKKDGASGEFVDILQYSDKISAGGGLMPANNVDIRVAFRRDWILRKGNPQDMSLIAVSGDSMAPTLMSGDLVLINHSHNHIDPQGGIYAIALGEFVLIKRLQILYPSGKVRVSSDNPTYDSVDLPQDEVKINGRVIWFGREI